ncbi:MAG: hypothetical protein OXE59_02455 [Bacteroidetes bacterium]|nr:hypothetical protein [Bacteroidota bacterium]
MKIAPTIIALLLLALGATNAQGQNSRIQRLQEKAEEGDSYAQLRLGMAYDSGEGVIENYAQAVYWYRKASMQGNAQAQFRLGLAYALGQGVDQDDQEAYSWIILAKATNELKMVVALIDGALEDLRDELTPTQITQAQKRASKLLEQIQANTPLN